MSTRKDMQGYGSLVIPVSQLGPEGREINTALDGTALHIEADEAFVLEDGHVHGRVERGEDEGVHFRGRLRVRLRLQCGRCLDPFTQSIDQDLDLFFLPRHRETASEEQDQDVELSDRDMLVAYYAEDRIDLGDTLREQILLTLPMRRLCRDECKGLCPSCGMNWNTGVCECKPVEAIDERLAPLRKLFDKGSS